MVKIIRRSGRYPLDQLRFEMDRVFGGLLPALEPFAPAAGGLPMDVDVRETDDEFLVRAEIPGIDPEALDVNFEDGVLTIAGEKRDGREEDEEGWRITERRFGSVRRSLRLPKGIDADGVKAEQKHGVLTVHLPKSAEQKPRRIAVESEG